MWRRLRLLRSAVWCVLVVGLSYPALLFGAEISPAASPGLESQAPFELKVHENQLSLKAEAASVKAILGEIGRQMQIDMVVRLQEDRSVTVAFSALPLQDALKRLGVSAATFVEEDREGVAVVTKIVVLDKGVSSPSVAPTERRAGSFQLGGTPTAMTDDAPLKIEVDPSKALRKP